MRPGVTVVIPTIAPRAGLLARAVKSVFAQTRRTDGLLVVADTEREGAAATRNRATFMVDTEWVAFLDDDDELLPRHLEALVGHAEATGADLVYPWFRVHGGTDPLGRRGMPFDPDALRQANYIPVTALARTEVVRAVGGFRNRPGEGAPCEDWGLWLAMLDAGASFSHLDEVTWVWHHHGRNTAGFPNRW